ncbi:hypothetical protein [Teichococcus rhizosphaerae]|uniref:hypothetical protein n=1 Tax=Teichococcus rhizosphaerae TaxID=1335062 RepID=UPI001145DC11|nr:hypothetical protein [Pseudoroseomonas rhizosphaerae]
MTVTWDELLRRFGAPSQDLVAFQAAFAGALRMVYAADPTITLAADEEGVTLGHAATAREAEVRHPAAGGPRGLPDPVSLRPHLTGLPGVVWLRRGRGDEPLVIGVTPGARLEPERLVLVLLEPLILQASGEMPQKEFEAVSAWVVANRDLIDFVWEGKVRSFEDVTSRIRKLAVSDWRQN